MKASELKDKSVEELQQTQIELLEEQFKLRMKSASGQISKTHERGKVRRNIARDKTILREKQGN